MKPRFDGLHIVTATVEPLKAEECFRSWLGLSRYHLPVHTVWSTLGADLSAKLTGPSPEREMLGDVFGPGMTCHVFDGGGVVPAFAYGVEAAFKEGAEMVLCLHDDVLLEQGEWDAAVLRWQGELHADFGGFGGGTSLGAANIYQVPYDPMQLARGGFASNMRDAEAHGVRATMPQQMAVFDGFSQFGRGQWFRDAWRWLAKSGIQHHAYDAAVACLAARAHVPGYLFPVKVHHYGGHTAVGSSMYQDWARTQNKDGDQGFWVDAHKITYEAFKDVLPVRV